MESEKSTDRQAVISGIKRFLSEPIKVLGLNHEYKNSSECSSTFFKKRPSKKDYETIRNFVMSK